MTRSKYLYGADMSIGVAAIIGSPLLGLDSILLGTLLAVSGILLIGIVALELKRNA